MKRVIRHIPQVNGRRGAFQLLFAGSFLMLAFAFFIAEDFPPALAWVGQFMTRPAPLGFLWLVPSLIGIVGAFLPRPRDSLSFAALTFAPAVWGGCYLIGGFASPHGTSILGMILYWCLAAALMVVSGMTGDGDRDYRKVSV